jgi:nucleoside-diphosphate-sugar epimerase
MRLLPLERSNCDSSRKALVVGNGFIGSFLSTQLRRGGYNVLNLSRNDLQRIDSGNLNLSVDLFSHYPINLFVYAAGSTDIGLAEKKGDADISDHLYMFQAAFSCFLGQKASISSAFLISSGGTMYGENCKPNQAGFTESDPLNPISKYGKRNVIIEDEFLSHSSESVRKCSLRVANPFHQSQLYNSRKGLFVSIIKSVLDNRVIHLVGNGATIRNYFPLSLLPEAIYALIDIHNQVTDGMPIALNCGLEVNLKSLECVKIVDRYMNSKANVVLDPHLPQYEIINSSLDCSHFTQLIKSRASRFADFGIDFLEDRIMKLVQSCRQL